MPTYEYECDACAHTFELLQSMADPAVRKCPKCRKLKVRRLISGGAGVIFKGSGFYETDYKRRRPGAGGASREGESKDGPPADASPKDGASKEPGGGPAKPTPESAAPKPKHAKEPGGGGAAGDTKGRSGGGRRD